MESVLSQGLPKFLADLDPGIFHSENYLVLDFETDTSGGQYGVATNPDNKLLLACWEYGLGHPWASYGTGAHWGGEYTQSVLLEAIEQADFVVAHNAKYELQWLRRCGQDMRKILVFDTKLAEYVLLGNLASGDERMPPRSLSLDVCAQRRGMRPKDPVVDKMIKHGINPVEIPRRWLEDRCKLDVSSTHALFKDQLNDLTRSNRLAVQYTRCLLTPVLADIEFEGMHLDAERVSKEYASHVAQRQELQVQMDAATGGINWRSPKQIGEFIYESLGFAELRKGDGTPRRTETGLPLTGNKDLEKLKASTPEQKEFLKLRKQLGKISAALSKNLEFFQGVCAEKGGVFRAEFNQTATATHRLSSSGIPTKFDQFKDPKTVQFQNLPRAFKRLFNARNAAWDIAEIDGAQLEFRVATELGGPDTQGMEDIKVGHDVHKFSAHILTKTAISAVTKAQRQDAKSETFKPLYGGSKGTAAQERYYAAFRERYPGINGAQRSWLNEVIETKRLITEWGLRFYWPYAKRSGRDGWVNCTSAVYNYKVQTLATAEIIPIAVVYFWHRMLPWLALIRLVNTVHDSVVAEHAPEARDTVRALALQCFTKDVYTYLEKVYKMDFRVPLGVGCTFGKHWGEGDEESYNVWKTGKVEKVSK